ncbi:E3 ubiquitin-protein ligase ZNF598 isoform X2 [Anabrus simplex]|uniref:E3 ubiquitin-protein ligase ZNF598 isoform X2 n=1 Tax=Anabrus simplex TaxID=316456 RepID=UPI0035A27E6B
MKVMTSRQGNQNLVQAVRQVSHGIFTGERRCYTRQELALHRRKGDPDDTSHRGHPLCEFCDQRYMDNDELFRHLRRDHLFCHFCDADGFHQYYSSYDFLREHFRADHYLCEEGGCVEEKFTSAFRSEIDLKAHRASVHGRSMGKAAAKQARTLELEFTLAPRPRDGRDGARGGRRGGPRPRSMQEEEPQGAVGGRNVSEHFEDTSAVFHNAPNLNTNCIEEFPTLNGGVPGTAPPSRPNSRQVAVNNSALTIRTIRQSQPPLAINDTNFPALGSDLAGSGCKTVRLSVNSSGGDRSGAGVANVVRNNSTKVPTNVSIHVNHRPNGALTTRLSSSQNFRVHPRLEEDFPSLSNSRSNVPTTSQWLGSHGNTGVKTRTQPSTKKVVEDFPSLSSRPGTKNNVEKKASSVIIPVSCSWSNDTPSNSVGNIKVRSKKKKPNKNSAVNEQASMGDAGKKKKPSISREEEIALKLQGILKCNEGKLERKRSELLIGNLASDEEDEDELPGNCPPGFLPQSSKSTPAPPPGFCSEVSDPCVKSPPPGFSVTLNSVARPQPNSLTFTNSSGESYSILPDKLHRFIPPHDSDRRNQALVTKVQRNVDNMDEFLQMSALFRQGSISAQTFYDHCMKTIGCEAFTDIFPELLVLLPDIDKQQDLLAVHEAADDKVRTSFELCAICDQVLSHSDLQYHQGRHSLDIHFSGTE